MNAINYVVEFPKRCDALLEKLPQPLAQDMMEEKNRIMDEFSKYLSEKTRAINIELGEKRNNLKKYMGKIFNRFSNPLSDLAEKAGQFLEKEAVIKKEKEKTVEAAHAVMALAHALDHDHGGENPWLVEAQKRAYGFLAYAHSLSSEKDLPEVFATLRHHQKRWQDLQEDIKKVMKPCQDKAWEKNPSGLEGPKNALQGVESFLAGGVMREDEEKSSESKEVPAVKSAFQGDSMFSLD